MTRWLLWIYKHGVSPVLHAAAGMTGACRFQPTCSEYAAQALIGHGPWRGSGLAIRRLCRCHPWGGSGYDPVPPPRNKPAKDLGGHARTWTCET